VNDSEFLPDDEVKDEDDGISKEVRALMKRYYHTRHLEVY
jgi:hypothetical protein